jgi:pimeloyl-ACP methyl ester carboxylesterase
MIAMASVRSARAATGFRKSRRWPRWWTALVAALAVLAAAGCGGGPVSGRSPSAPALFPTQWKACTPSGYVGKCRTVWVPEDWAHPRGPRIPLLVAVIPATAATHPAAPLFALAGWGGSAISSSLVDFTMMSFGQLTESMDLVFVVQRGTPDSWPQTCPGLDTTGPGLRAAVRHCLASASRSPRHDTTAAAARDLDQVRKVLGYNKINLFGASYGVSMGLAYLQRYGAHVRSAVFYSGSLLNVPLWQETPVHAQQAFDQLARRCAAAPACARHYHPAADLATVVNRLRAHPARVTVTGAGGRPETITITLAAFLGAIIDDYLSSPDTAVLLPGDLHALARGQWAKVIAERGLASAISAAAAPTQLQMVTIRCGDAWAAMNPATIAQQNRLSLFTPAMAPTAAWQRQLCALWPHDPGVSGVVRSNVPVVFVNGTADPVDPPANVAAAPRTMPHALLVTVPGGSHDVASTGCLAVQASAFIQAGKPNRAAWAACARTLGHKYPAFPPAP